MFEFGFLQLMIIGTLVGGVAVVVLFRRKTQNIPKPQQSSANIESVSDDPKNKCPLCNQLISMNINWICASCGKKYYNTPLFVMVCDYCYFSPHYVECPHCHRDVAIMSLLGNYISKEGKIIPHHGRPSNRGGKLYQLNDLNVYRGNIVDHDILQAIGKEVIDACLLTKFNFNGTLGSARILYAANSSEEEDYIHFQLFQSEKPDDKSIGQVSFMYSNSKKKVEVRVIDIF